MNPAPGTAAVPDYSAGIWKADPVRSEIAFSVRQLRFSTVRGRFTSHEVTIVTSKDPLSSSVTATIDLASIDTGNERRDDHLRSAHYFDVEKHPTMRYRSTGVRRTGDSWIIDGELTFHGITRQVPLAVEVNEFGPDPLGGRRAGFSATAMINRRDYGIDIAMDGLGFVVDAQVPISLEIEAVLQK